jgi:transcriptional regulator
MYVPKHFQNHNAEEISAFIRHNSFGILVSQSDKLLATHIPLELSDDGTKVSGHLSKANPQWKSFTETKEVLAIFNGPHAYVSSSWYDHENVPTWNYIAVHVYGTIKVIEGEPLRLALKNIMHKYEQHEKNPRAIEDLSAEYLDRAIKGIVGFEITITSIEATYKLSQNRDAKNHNTIVRELGSRQDHHSKEIADAMIKNRNNTLNPK